MKVTIKITDDKTWTDQPLELEISEAEDLYKKLAEIFGKRKEIVKDAGLILAERLARDFRDFVPPNKLEKRGELAVCLKEVAHQVGTGGSNIPCSCPKCSPRM